MSAVLVAARPDHVDGASTMVVAMGQCAIADGDSRLRAVGLGSCLAVIIFAPDQQLAGLAHCMLPSHDDGTDEAAGRYVDTAIPDLLDALRRAGAAAPFTATLVGGASMFPGVADGQMRDIGEANVRTARSMLTNSAIPIRSEAVGGHIGRSVVIDPLTQRVVVHTIRYGARCL